MFIPAGTRWKRQRTARDTRSRARGVSTTYWASRLVGRAVGGRARPAILCPNTSNSRTLSCECSTTIRRRGSRRTTRSSTRSSSGRRTRARTQMRTATAAVRPLLLSTLPWPTTTIVNTVSSDRRPDKPLKRRRPQLTNFCFIYCSCNHYSFMFQILNF